MISVKDKLLLSIFFFKPFVIYLLFFPYIMKLEPSSFSVKGIRILKHFHSNNITISRKLSKLFLELYYLNLLRVKTFILLCTWKIYFSKSTKERMLLSAFFLLFSPSDGPKNLRKRKGKKPRKLFSLEQSYIDCLAGVLALEH